MTQSSVTKNPSDFSALYAESENYRLKCESTMEKKKADQYKKSAKKKTAQLNKNTAPEDKV